MVTSAQNEALTRVAGDAPMGQMMRARFWVPFAIDHQVKSGDAPRRVRLFGSDYIAFRDTAGKVALLDERCPHRGTSLALARSEGCVIRCIFHGWAIDAYGKVVDVPAQAHEPEKFARKVKVATYPVQEIGGMLWAWLGEGVPGPFPKLPQNSLPRENIWLTTTTVNCNWLQGLEGTIDSAHIGYLHRSWLENIYPSRKDFEEFMLGSPPRYEVKKTDFGLLSAALRPQPDGTTNVRVSDWVMPFISTIPGPAGKTGDGVIFAVAPVDDTNHILFFGHYAAETRLDENDSRIMGQTDGSPIDVNNFAAFTGEAYPNWGQDRAAMDGGHFSGFTRIGLQEDVIVQLSMGAIVDRTKEYLSLSDFAIVQTRQFLLDELKAYREGVDRSGVSLKDIIRPVDIVLKSGEDWGNAREDILSEYMARRGDANVADHSAGLRTRESAVPN